MPQNKHRKLAKRLTGAFNDNGGDRLDDWEPPLNTIYSAMQTLVYGVREDWCNELHLQQKKDSRAPKLFNALIHAIVYQEEEAFQLDNFKDEVKPVMTNMIRSAAFEFDLSDERVHPIICKMMIILCEYFWEKRTKEIEDANINKPWYYQERKGDSEQSHHGRPKQWYAGNARPHHNGRTVAMKFMVPWCMIAVWLPFHHFNPTFGVRYRLYATL